MSLPEVRGILRNKSESQEHKDSSDQLDRQEVIKNTRLNAQLASESSKGDQIRAKIAQKKSSNNPDHEHLKWDEINLYKAEQDKSATMKIDEPKTPYEGGFNPEGEYYRDDEEEIPDFQLGEGEFDEKKLDNVSESLNGGQIFKDENYQSEEEEEKEKPVTAEEKHKRFEEKRKEHYHTMANPLKQKVSVSDDEE